ncbi:orotidine 5'-phosphate decarboxylase [Clostridium carboxidivorans P7]|uniref:Orotidine 5'-phosphate decarboxylase n=1 Tax=Clostridium carboxidivorans P7 TaxID=536227 RepID=C6Q1L8_9CLOT|nr:orotidine-5'-phosphate decarboxylase [Clostridium carboxidivorans]AKN32694.1 orotidine 5'-phosphate decarboxylase [Clostridium carboxidivorans P7]EET84611.1 orotidine 5'-phosphate decarboxylase [Clostridium carboxidivorans P7]EFG90071.1 orotidine 5'-phosphate decarboxylase [Clostridium carboxidivorans P7]
MIIDKLFESVEKNGHVCVGLDTDVEYIPKWVINKNTSIEDAIFEYNKNIIDATLDVASCYKVQIAYYEALGISGLMVYKKTLEYIRSKKAIVIADIKRGDIAKTAEMYARAHFEGDFESDFVTLNPYMGLDGVEPYLPYVKNKEKGLFLLVRTSNKGAEDIQYVDTKEKEKVYNVVGEKIQQIGEQCMGSCGYSSIGGVVGCTHVEEGIKLRADLNKMFFLIPGYGAQGGKAEDVALYLHQGNGGVVNSSRGILLAYKKVEDGEKNYAECARKEAVRMRDDILSKLKINS